ncbi:MAG: threonine dehydratase [Paracrocinitomix sp.]|jgi:threonine dehydratase
MDPSVSTSPERADEQRSGWGGPAVAPSSLEAIREAAGTIAGVSRNTPLVPLRSYGLAEESLGIELKLETLQDVASFKIRGVYNWLSHLTPAERAAGLNTHSAGNTAQALGYAAQRFGCDAQTLVPNRTPEGKLEAIRKYGVKTIAVSMDELLDFIFSAGWTEEPQSYLNPWGDPMMIAGNATVALEILEERPDMASLFVPVGGGGLLAGVGSAVRALKSSCRVVAVQVESCQALSGALSHGGPVWVPMGDSLSDISLPVIVDELFPLLASVVDEVITVGEDELREAVRILAVENKVVAEGAGALALAGALQVDQAIRGESACIVSGASLDPATLANILGH